MGGRGRCGLKYKAMIPVIMGDGSPAQDEDMSFLYDEKGLKRSLDYVMDFTEHFPYWKELPKPEGYNNVGKVGGVWYWTVDK